MTNDAKHEIAAILTIAYERLRFTRSGYVLLRILMAYYHEWGWVTYEQA